MKRALPLVLALLSLPAWATAYYFAGGVYTTRYAHQTCGTGACADYPAGARITGSFTTAAPLAASLPSTEITGSVTSCSFSDGVHAYANADANARIVAFSIATDASGKPSSATIQLQLWQAPAPHNAGNARLNLMQFASNASAGTNATCASFGTSPAGAADACLSYSGSSDTSQGVSVLPTRTAIGAPLPLSLTPATCAYTGATYTTIDNHSSCTTGTCADYASSMRVAGTFTLADRLPPNFGPADVSGLVGACSFSDGVHTIASGQPLARIVQFALQTDAGGVPASSQIGLEQWQAAPPHPSGSRLDMIGVSASGSSAGINVDCTTAGASAPGTGTPDSRLNPATVTDTSFALAEGGGWVAVPAASSTAATPVPALAREGWALLAIALIALAAVALRRRSAA